ncbi:MAG: UDP-N-acetylmuramoyl-tripeptide--D-alanyl-D-alanine ligase [Rhodospirillales bacterium 70-18]|nr:MAG: UDP-N-acetylmuramoyl-tripeptide--D-alanyl-D-alanine ligase [Rhodospirillales bacterium 70-18]
MSALWSPQALLAATGGLLRAPFAATGVSIDTRTLRPGDLFVALLGEHGDGHAHVAAALAKGAAGAMVHRLPEGVADDAKLLQVADTLEGLRALAAFARARFAGRLVAVTGSVGKTTTKEMLRRICTAHGKTWAAEASHNNQWGLPLTLARLPAHAAFCIAEIGMNHAGETAPLAALARPHVAVITAIAPAHVGNLGSIEAIADEKAMVLTGLEREGVAVLPADTPLLDRLFARVGDARVILFGEAATATVRLLAAQADAEGTDIAARVDGQEVALRIAAPGRHMAMNALAALAAAHALGLPAESAAAVLAGFAPGAGRGARRTVPLAGGTALLLDESYNASPVAVRAALRVLALPPATRRVVVLGDMLELGAHGPAEHAALAPDVAAVADLLFTCGPLMRGLFEAVPAALRGAHAADSQALAPLVAAALRSGDAVLVKGSLGSRMKTIVQAIEPAETPAAEAR